MLVRMTCPCQEPISLIILLNRTVKTWAWKLLIFHVHYNIRSRESKAVTYIFLLLIEEEMERTCSRFLEFQMIAKSPVY